jgi:GDPmannose 4,6-dehydratase
MWMMLQHDTPDDFVLATGETHPVRACLSLSWPWSYHHSG